MAAPKADFRDKKLLVRLFGRDVYAVGGYVRDLLRRMPSNEVDILVARHPLESIIRKLSPHGRVDLVGKSFGIIKFTRKEATYDVALPRSDTAKGSGSRSHKDIAAAADPFLPIDKDLERRDFRCNSIALRLADGLLIDPFGGRRDIARKVIRVANARAFPEDPLRVLRAARFASVLNFRVDPAVYALAKDLDLSGLSAERVTEELFKILLHSSRPSLGLEELFQMGALGQLFPELNSLTLALQDPVFHPEKDAYGNHTVWYHARLTVDQAAALGRFRGLTPEKALCLNLAALYHDVGKPATSAWEHKHGRMVLTNIKHDVRSEEIARRAFDRLKIHSWNRFDLRKTCLILIRSHHRASELWQNRESVTKKAFNRLAHDAAGEVELLVLLDAADRAGRRERLTKGFDRTARWLIRKFEEMRISKETIQPLLRGRDVMPLGVEPGPDMGRLLKKLYMMQLDNVFEDRAGGLRAARHLLREGRS